MNGRASSHSAAKFDILEHIIQDDGYDRLYVPVSIAATPRSALCRIVEYGHAIAGSFWRYEVIERPWHMLNDVERIWMRQGAENTEPGWWSACGSVEDGAVPFWQVWA